MQNKHLSKNICINHLNTNLGVYVYWYFADALIQSDVQHK